MSNISLVKLNNLRGINEQASNGETMIHIYPCSGCGAPMLWLGHHGDVDPILNIELEDYKSVKIASTVFNHLNDFEVDMTPNNVLTLLNEIFVKKDLAVSE